MKISRIVVNIEGEDLPLIDHRGLAEKVMLLLHGEDDTGDATEPAPKITLIPGHRYRTRSGDVTGPVKLADGYGAVFFGPEYPYMAELDGHDSYFMANGRYHAKEENCRRDLVEDLGPVAECRHHTGTPCTLRSDTAPEHTPKAGDVYKLRGGGLVLVLFNDWYIWLTENFYDFTRGLKDDGDGGMEKFAVFHARYADALTYVGPFSEVFCKVDAVRDALNIADADGDTLLRAIADPKAMEPYRDVIDESAARLHELGIVR